MTDSNLDWNQCLRQIPAWLDDHAMLVRDRPVYIHPRAARADYVGAYYLNGRVRFVDRGKPPPTHGILIISPVWVAGVYDPPGENPYAFLQSAKPLGTIGGSLLVYDLDIIDSYR